MADASGLYPSDWCDSCIGMSTAETAAADAPASDFIRDKVRSDLASGRFSRVQTRFPPEPNGYLHIGHAKAIAVDFQIAEEFGGTCRLRFDDTNPTKEDISFVDGIIADLRWLGYEPDGEPVFASDYFEQIYRWAEHLITVGLAYVDDQDGETISAGRGGYGKPGIESPFRNRSVEENLDLFRRMRAGEFADSACVLRAKIDMQNENMQLRDPIMYRIRHAHHFRTGDAWCIYPTYDWAHGQSDAIEGVTHSLCSLEFDAHRELYDWYLAHVPFDGERPEQTEFARLGLTYTVMSKRKLATLVADGQVDGWDDPRMPTLRGMRKRGYPASAIRTFCAMVGVARTNGTNEIELLESVVRDELNVSAERRMAVLNPVKVVLTNWPAGHIEMREANNLPGENSPTRLIPFSGELWIERDDFMEVPAPKYYRLFPGNEVRLRYGYLITCDEVVKDADGNVTELRCTYDPETAGGQAPDGRKVKATLHWVSAAHAVDATVIQYDRLFTDPFPDGHDGVDPLDFLNPVARTRIANAKLEPSLAALLGGAHVQFERLAYYCVDEAEPLTFHQTVGLKDEWARLQKRT
jgi:glutaminyl-tRNA synthetase